MATFRSEELPSTDDLGRLRVEMRKQIDLIFAVLMEEVESDRTDRLVVLADRLMRERDDAVAASRQLEFEANEAKEKVERALGIADDLRRALGRALLSNWADDGAEIYAALEVAVREYDDERDRFI